MIDGNPENFEDWGCKINCVKSTCYFENHDPVNKLFVISYIDKYSNNCK